MKLIFGIIIILFTLISVFAQNEQAPIVQKDIEYKDWTYKDVETGAEVNLRKFASGKKLVMVVYFAPWCGNWKHDLPFVQSMYDKYKDSGFDVIAVGEYDPVDTMKAHVSQYKLSFPVVWESESRSAKQNTAHYRYRRSVGDARNWGSPWYIFLEGAKIKPSGETLVTRAPIVNGEVIQSEAEKFIREKLGLGRSGGASTSSLLEAVDACDPAKPSTALVNPEPKKP